MDTLNGEKTMNIDTLLRKRNIGGIVILLGLSVSLGYFSAPAFVRGIERPCSRTEPQTVLPDRSSRPTGVSLAQMYPFAEPEKSRANASGTTSDALRQTARVSTGVPGQVRAGNLPLPAIPARQPAQAANSQEPKPEANASPQAKSNYQTKIAFIGGEGVPGQTSFEKNTR